MHSLQSAVKPFHLIQARIGAVFAPMGRTRCTAARRPKPHRHGIDAQLSLLAMRCQLAIVCNGAGNSTTGPGDARFISFCRNCAVAFTAVVC
jgi:hypothetical protein